MRRYLFLNRVWAYPMIALAASLTALNYYVFVVSNAFAPAGGSGVRLPIKARGGQPALWPGAHGDPYGARARAAGQPGVRGF